MASGRQSRHTQTGGNGRPPFRVGASPDAAAEANETQIGNSSRSAVARPSRTAFESRPKNITRSPSPTQRSIDDYSRDELVTALLKGMGKKWWTRDDAIRAATRRLGFHRTGRQIREAFKSAVTGAIRRGLLEYDGNYIRKK